MKFNIFFIIIAITLISGCKSTSNNHIPKGMNSDKSFELRMQTYALKSCCEDLHNITPLQIKTTISATMEESEKLIKVGNVSSPYLLVEIENTPDTYFYSIKSYFLEHKFAFIPEVSVLDSNFNVISQTTSDYINYRHQTPVKDDSHFWMYFSVDTRNKPNAKYFLVHTAQEFGTKMQVQVASQTYMKTSMVGNQKVSSSETFNGFAVEPVVAPSGVLQIDKLDYWTKPANKLLIQSL